MSKKNGKADGGEWNLVSKENEYLFWEHKVHMQDGYRNSDPHNEPPIEA
jgi:hypothetical protein